MMPVPKHKNIVQWFYWQVPLNVVPRIPLLGYLDIDQGHICQMKGRACSINPASPLAFVPRGFETDRNLVIRWTLRR
jgi:hypothetical protein